MLEGICIDAITRTFPNLGGRTHAISMGCDVEYERKRRTNDKQKVFILGTEKGRESKRIKGEKAIGKIVSVGGYKIRSLI